MIKILTVSAPNQANSAAPIPLMALAHHICYICIQYLHFLRYPLAGVLWRLYDAACALFDDEYSSAYICTAKFRTIETKFRGTIVFHNDLVHFHSCFQSRWSYFVHVKYPTIDEMVFCGCYYTHRCHNNSGGYVQPIESKWRIYASVI